MKSVIHNDFQSLLDLAEEQYFAHKPILNKREKLQKSFSFQILISILENMHAMNFFQAVFL